ncbi:MAG: signal peptidase I, partial [Planctomycetota bacterium]
MDRRRIRAFACKLWREWRLAIFLIVFVVLPVKSSVADFNWVPSGSMKPTILEGDFVLVNKAAYDLRIPLTLHRLATWADPERGDIVICFSPDEGKRLIKRVVGLPGDVLELRDNRLFINGQFAQQSQIDPH